MIDNNTSASRGFTEESGQTLVEFVIVVPLLAMILLFSIWFYDVVQIKLKVQEAARYAAWEATAYPLHDYRRARWRKALLSARAMAQISADTAVRYGDLDSATLFPKARSRISTSWSQPVALVVDSPEEPMAGGVLSNIGFGLGATIFDAISSLGFSACSKSTGRCNVVATQLIRSGKGLGGARRARFFGSPQWGFNRMGYFRSQVSVTVTNQWFAGSLGRWLLPHTGVVLTERNAVLADAWRLNHPAETYGGPMAPGHAKTSPLWKQVDRMYFVNRRTRAVAQRWMTQLQGLMAGALAGVRSGGGTLPTGLNPADFVKTSVVSGVYNSRLSGKRVVRQDMVPIVGQFDTAPLPPGSGYAEAMRKRGKHFMGCRLPNQLGCTDSLAQDNPFGDYLVRQ